jgi:hypothetical protein
MPDLTELDRLIEEGLTLYGQGDLDGALLIWEKALSVDPENPQANSYVDYVRMNYEMLTTDAGNDEAAPFGIANDEPEYQIEIMPGEAKESAGPGAPMYMDPGDVGWFMESEPDRAGGPPSRPSEETSEETIDKQIDEDPGPVMLELDADEPPSRSDPNGVSFEDQTREFYQPRAKSQSRAPAQLQALPLEAPHEMFAPEGTATREFNSEGTPGFSGSEITDIRKREQGFVKAVQEAAPDPDELPAPPPRPRRASQAPPELKMTLRTPSPEEEPPPPPTANVAVSYADPVDPSDDLIDSLPSPKAAHVTRDLPSDIVRPHATLPPPMRMSLDAFDVGEPELPPDINVSFSSAPTTPPVAPAPAEEPPPPEEEPPPPQEEPPPAPPLRDTSTRDFADKPTQEITQRPPAEPDPLISAPTRELGLRPPHSPRARTEDEPTAAKLPLDPAKIFGANEGTRSDVVLSFDPIDARTARILDEVDAGVPENEAKDDQTRRRISALLERATEWSKGSDLDRAVAAVDLALSEDPNSALAQKLIHRNRDTIMSVFQAFLGDLNRQPILARPLHELASSPISPRAAFLLSRVDGSLSIDEILDVSGMPRLEAYRYLCQLLLRGILR